MKTSNLRKKSVASNKEKRYISNRKKKDYEPDDDISDQDEYEQDLQDLKFKLHSINYNYYTEALKLMLYEKSRPLMPLKLGPLIQGPNAIGESSMSQNEGAAYAPQFNQGNIQQYNSMVAPTNQQINQSQRGLQQLPFSQSSPQLQPYQNQNFGTLQSRGRLPSGQINMQDRLPPIGQQNNYQRSRFAEQLPIIASQMTSQMGQQSPQFQSQYNTQLQPMSPLDQNDTYYQNQRLTQIGTPNPNFQESVQYIDGKRYKIKQMVVNSPIQTAYGADQYTNTMQKKKKQNKNQQNGSPLLRKNDYNFDDNGLQDIVPQKINKKEILKQRQSQRIIDNLEREDYKLKNRSQKQIQQLYDDEDQDDYKQTKKQRGKSRNNMNDYNDDGDYDDDGQSVRSKVRQKSRKQTTIQRKGGDVDDEEERTQNRRKKQSRQNLNYQNDDDEYDDDDLQQGRSKVRQKSRKQSMVSRKGGDIDEDEDRTQNRRKKQSRQNLNQQNDDDDDDHQSVRSRGRSKSRKQSMVQRNKSRALKKEDIDDYEGLEEFRPKKSTKNIPIGDDENDGYQDTRSITKQRKKTLQKIQNDEEQDQEEKQQRRKTYLQKKAIASRRIEDGDINQDDEEQIPTKNSHKKTFVAGKKKTVLMSKNQINSLGYLNEEDE